MRPLPTRTCGRGSRKHSDGYLVQVANRQCVEYVEPHRKAMIEVDFGNSVGVYIETLNGWLSEAGVSPMSATDRERVISGIVVGLEAMGTVELCWSAAEPVGDYCWRMNVAYAVGLSCWDCCGH